MKLRIIWLVVLLGLLGHAQAGGGWVYKQGKGYFKLTHWWAVSPLNYDVTGELTNQMPVGYFNSSFYGELGLSDRLTGILYVPFFSRMTNYRVNSDPLEPREMATGFGDVDISFKYGLFSYESFVGAATLTLGVPFGRTGLGMNESLATGDGEMNVMFRVDASSTLNLGFVLGWASAYTAYNARSLTFSDEFRFGAELGFKFWKDRILAIGRLDRVDALGPLESNTGSIFSNNFEFLNLTGEIGVNVTKKLGLAVTYTKAVSGRSFYESPSFAVGAYLNL